MQPGLQDAHSGVVPPPPPPPQVAQRFDWTHFLKGMAQIVAQHRDVPAPQGGSRRVLRVLAVSASQVSGTTRSRCGPVMFHGVAAEERVLLVSYQLQGQALAWWTSEWEITFQSRPLRQITWQEFVAAFERPFCPSYVRTKRLYQFLVLTRGEMTVVQYRARFVELGHYAPQIMADESLRTQQFLRGLRPELRQALIVARVTDLDAAYQIAAALEADTLRTRGKTRVVQAHAGSSQQQSSSQQTSRTMTSYTSCFAGTSSRSGSWRRCRRDRRQAEQRQPSVESVQQPFRFTHFCLGSVDTRSSQVDTSSRFQKVRLTLDQGRSTLVPVSTLDQGRSTLDPVSSRTVLQKWDSGSTLDQGRSTHSG
ncbi:hypothetical protein Taro_044704 [Colocasia esculenta]|uniref:Retrotransposon gag domain-containing protein n=1 Tax=Colocasia esculenta TaxID=4460 RepID=A0A843X360_COLES|nr:hypothetical protein [Colocasia esculenta]